ncbi:hypothetical protein ACP4OV_023466 [Aristida adscensionis]
MAAASWLLSSWQIPTVGAGSGDDVVSRRGQRRRRPEARRRNAFL